MSAGHSATDKQANSIPEEYRDGPRVGCRFISGDSRCCVRRVILFQNVPVHQVGDVAQLRVRRAFGDRRRFRGGQFAVKTVQIRVNECAVTRVELSYVAHRRDTHAGGPGGHERSPTGSTTGNYPAGSSSAGLGNSD